MKYFLLIVLIYSTPVLSFKCKQFKNEWRLCRKTSDCTLIEGTCSRTAVNILSAKEAQNYFACVATYARCNKAMVGKDSSLVKCELNKCVKVERQFD